MRTPAILLLLTCFCSVAPAQNPPRSDRDASAFLRDTLSAYRAMSSFLLALNACISVHSRAEGLLIGYSPSRTYPTRVAPADPDARAFMRETLARYRAMSSYRDHGYMVETLQSSPDGKNPGVITQEFVTLFKRPNKFKFAWTTTDNFGDGADKDQDAIWSDGTKVWGSWSSQEHNVPETLQDFDTAVASATGVSHRMAHQIFALLSDDVTGFRLDMLRHARIVRSETMQGADCYVVRGSQYEDQHEFWIGKLDHLIRKGIDTRPDGTTATFERWDIAVDQDIAASEFNWHKE